MPAVRARPWTAAEVRQLIADNPALTPRYELVDGELLVTPSPGAPHQRTVRMLLGLLDAYLTSNRLGEVYVSPSDVELEPEFISQPDLFVLGRAEALRVRREGFPVFNLMLAIEVVSPSSGRHDRVLKRPKYQRHVPEYWIMDPDSRLVERWRPGDERPEINSEELVWLPSADVPPFTVNIDTFFAGVFATE